MKWLNRFPGYWEYKDHSTGQIVATIVQGRVSLMCTANGKDKQFGNMIHWWSLKRAKKWCEENCGR